MENIPAWRMGEFVRIALQYLWDKPKGATSREILRYIPRATQLSEDESKAFPGSPAFRAYEILVEAALRAVAKSGWLTREKFKWCITDEGRLACQDFTTAEEFYTESQKIVQQENLTHSMAMIVLEEAEIKAWDQIRHYLLGLSHHEFRQLVKDLLEAMGYHVTWCAPPEKERGSVDIIASTDPLGMGNSRLVIQIKHKGLPLSEDGMEAAISLLGNRDAGLVISTSGFTPEAKELVRQQFTNEMALMDLVKFFDLWMEHYSKLPNAAHKRFPLRSVFFLSET